MNIYTHPTEYKEWLASLKAGDQVCVNTGYGWSRNGYTFYTIERTTATQLISSQKNALCRPYPVRFRKSDGQQVGGGYTMRIELITDKVREINTRNKLESWASSLKPKQLTTECLKAMKEAHDKAQAEVEAKDSA